MQHGQLGRWGFAALVLSGCMLGPSEERLNCLQVCAKAKDDCMLPAQNAAEVQACDVRSQRCSVTCPQ